MAYLRSNSFFFKEKTMEDTDLKNANLQWWKNAPIQEKSIHFNIFGSSLNFLKSAQNSGYFLFPR
jgi:hypothetical protein